MSSSKPKQYKPPSRNAPGRKFDGRKHITDLYDEVWNKYRKRFLDENPKCYSCGERAWEVDHVVPHKGDKKLFEKLDNHIPLCTSCHSTVTALFDKKYVAGSSVTNKIRWLQNKRLQNDLFFKVKVLPYYHDC